jgi:hypothetical protein
MKFELPANARCKDCGRLIANMDLPFCPECRRPFDPLDRNSFDVPPRRGPGRAWLTAAVIILLAVAVTVSLYVRGYLR